MEYAAVVTIAALLLAYAAISERLRGTVLTAPIVFCTAGLLLGSRQLGWIHVSETAEGIKLVAEVALAITLFADAVRIDLRALRKGVGIPARLLGIGLPLTLVAGTVVALLVHPAFAMAQALLLAAILAPTDAALGETVVSDQRLPVAVRQSLNVESGLNDGLAVPFYLVAFDLTASALSGRPGTALLIHVFEQIGLGLAAGIVAGAAGGAVVRYCDARGWVEGAWRQVIMLASAGLAFGLAQVVGGSGFISAFAGGVSFGLVARARGLHLAHLTEQTSGILGALTFAMFGALALRPALGRIDGPMVAYAVLSLTVVRMVPVVLALLGSRLRWPTIAFIGWFGPRGLASIVFGLGILGAGLPGADRLLPTAAITVGLSIYAHGVTARLLTRAYVRWFGSLAVKPAAESADVHEHRVRLGSDQEASELLADGG